MELKDNVQLDWINQYKGICIMLVVFGHASSPFNNYIYLFHMGAFFFISGYLLKLDETFKVIFIKKIYSLIWPIFIFFSFFICLQFFMNKIGIYRYFWQTDFLGFKSSYKYLFQNVMVIDLLGATWFLIVLFSVILLLKIISLVIKDYFSILIISFLLLTLGYYFVENSMIFFKTSFDLVLIAQFYVVLGQVAKKQNIYDLINQKKSIVKIMLLILFFCGLTWATQNGGNVNYPTRYFNNIFINTFANILGILSLFIIVMLICKIKIIGRIFSFFGINSLGVLLLHFFIFRILFFVLYLFDFVKLDFCLNLVPTEIYWFWFPLSMVTLFSTSLLWKFIKKSSILSIIAGTNKEFIYSLCKYINGILTF